VAALLHQRPWQRIEVPSLISSITTTHKMSETVGGVQSPMGLVDPAADPYARAGSRTPPLLTST
jgi:hypothetical protein